QSSWRKLSGVLLQEREPIHQHPHPLPRRLNPPSQRLILELELDDSLPGLDQLGTHQDTATSLEFLDIIFGFERTPPPRRELLTYKLQEFGELIQRTSVRTFVVLRQARSPVLLPRDSRLRRPPRPAGSDPPRETPGERPRSGLVPQPDSCIRRRLRPIPAECPPNAGAPRSPGRS